MNRDNKTPKPTEPIGWLRGFLVLDFAIRLQIWSFALAATCAVFTKFDLWPRESIINANFSTAWQWAGRVTAGILMFNSWYVVGLILIRLIVPTPKEGRFPIYPGAKVNRNLVFSILLAILTKARYEAPFPAFLVFHMANLPPLVWLMSPIFGPRSRSCYVVEPLIIDPHMVEVGRNVTFGFGAVVAGHTQDRDEVILKKTVIGDDVLIGGNVIVYGGCHIGQGSIVLGGAIVESDTIIGDYEIWGGIPARKIKDYQAPDTNSISTSAVAM